MPADTLKPTLPRTRRRTQWALALLGVAGNSFGGSILFIGNSFTFAHGSPVRYYRADTVTDLNSAGQGGVWPPCSSHRLVAFDQLAAQSTLKPSGSKPVAAPAPAMKCSAAR